MPYASIDLDSIDWDQFFRLQKGGGQADSKFFVGQKYMRGYGFLGTLGKYLLPVAKNLAESLGNEAVTSGTRIMKDVAEGKNISDSLKEHSKQGLANIGEKLKQCGKGSRTKKKIEKKYFDYNIPKNMLLTKNTDYKPRYKKPRKRKPDQLDYF
jgi:hypothetical protein